LLDDQLLVEGVLQQFDVVPRGKGRGEGLDNLEEEGIVQGIRDHLVKCHVQLKFANLMVSNLIYELHQLSGEHLLCLVDLNILE
jgi:hypothetical protein